MVKNITAMEYASHIQEKLHEGHEIITAVEAELLQDSSQFTCITTLIKCEYEIDSVISYHGAILVFKTAKMSIHSAADLSLELVLPVDENFSFSIESNEDCGSAIACITSTMKSYRFEMPFGQRTNNFIAEVMKMAEDVAQSVPKDLTWLNSYQVKSDSTDSLRRGLAVTSSLVKATSHQVSLDKLEEYGSFTMDSIRSSSLPSILEPRDVYLKQKLQQNRDLYTDTLNLVFFIGTWNVNGQLPSRGLAEWLACDLEPPDVYAVAFQELDLTTGVYITNVTPQEEKWLDAVLTGVHPGANYKQVQLIRLVGMMLILLVQEKHVSHVRNVATSMVGTGIMNKLGNKGGVSIRMDFYDTSVCFVNVHLAAHVEELERRNEDFDCIMRRTEFEVGHNSPHLFILDHDHVYFFGDMNYRVDQGDYSIRDLASKNEFHLLLENDQLCKQRKLQRVFRGFEEGPINFKPTFKYDLFTDNWDTSEKQRDPAWCDRILWRGKGISQCVYRSHPHLDLSDHKPVSSVFAAQIKVIDKEKYRQEVEKHNKLFDQAENEKLPQVMVDNTDINMGTVFFLQTVKRDLTIANTGLVPVEFLFHKKEDEPSYCKPWLKIYPARKLLMQGEKCDISLEVTIDAETVWKFHSCSEKLYDILILHLVNGKDIFITVFGEYKRSCFGTPINTLVYISKPFKSVDPMLLSNPDISCMQDESSVPYSIPKELWYLAGHLYRHGCKSRGLFTIPGTKEEFLKIRECLDDGVPDMDIPGSMHAIADAILLLLHALPEPVITYDLYDKALNATQDFSLCLEVVKELPTHHKVLFDYLMRFLTLLLENSADNGLDAKTLAKVFGDVLLRDPHSINDKVRQYLPTRSETRRTTFIHHFLVNKNWSV